MKTMCPLGYHHNGFVATHALGHMMYGYTLLVPMNQRVLNKQSREHNINIYIFPQIMLCNCLTDCRNFLGKTNKLIYCNSEFYVFTIIRQ